MPKASWKNCQNNKKIRMAKDRSGKERPSPFKKLKLDLKFHCFHT